MYVDCSVIFLVNWQKENEELKYNLANISSTSGGSAQKLKEGYLQKLNDLEKQVLELKRKLDAQSQPSNLKLRSNDARKRLQDEILRMKAQKGELQRKIKEESMQCSNREAGSIRESDELSRSEMAEGIGNSSDSDENEKSHILASHGAMLLQSALVEKPAETNDDCGSKRKPLSDIGNKLV
ncbi:hypothetical protein L1049_026605 [Liquidambar formosana]|uniref:Uncharacterized protein n=1 Tax=Liquidambar formosana TaxID=63359 RepID=A0AAP0R5K4_LIQFO